MVLELNKVHCMDCLEGLKQLKDNSVAAVVTDPPYGLKFMGKKWDCSVPSVDIWKECLRVLKPGGYLLSFAGTRTQHRMAVNIEDAGFEIRDMIAWVYGSGFPKSLNVGKVIDKLQGNERELIGIDKRMNEPSGIVGVGQGERKEVDREITKGTSEWEGWGTALKPALEPITVARKPLSEKTVAKNVLKWGTGGINIDGCRVETTDKPKGSGNPVKNADPKAIQPGRNGGNGGNETSPLGRFPANLIHDGSDEVVDMFPNTKSGAMKKAYKYTNNGYSLGKPTGSTKQIHEANSGSASRFFYCAKASKKERNAGCEELEEKYNDDTRIDKDAIGCNNPNNRSETSKKNFHPTVKPIALMEYLVKLVSKKGSVVLDPFMGSGTTAISCVNLGRNFIGFERDKDYVEIANKRIKQSSIQKKIW